MTLGLRDIPLEKEEDEALGFLNYAEALSEFILDCETPLTIALQGDWGSGKTSLMNLIVEDLKRKPLKPKTVWFNTWQFSQFGMEGELAISLISHLLECIDSAKETKKIVSSLRTAMRFGRHLLPTMAGAVGGNIVESITKSLMAKEVLDGASQILKLKKAIEDAAKKIIESDPKKKRIVVFVDDLDRLLPERAVELLEVLKLFLDVPGCVFVLACDYHVISQGLKHKFGVGSDDLKGKHFFDKIIQLPFNMPVSQYDVKSYFERLLSQINIKCPESDLALYIELTNHSVGFNPRSMKRIFNSLLLLNIVAKRKKIFEVKAGSAVLSEKQRVLFASICLQMGFEPFYHYLLKNISKAKELMEKFRDLKPEEADKETMTDIQEIVKDENTMVRFKKFMGVFYDAVKLESDGDENRLSTKEMENLRSILTLSALTSAGTKAESESHVPEGRYDNKDFAKAFALDFNKRHAKELESLGCQATVYQPRNGASASVYFWFFIDSKKMQPIATFNMFCSENENSYLRLGMDTSNKPGKEPVSAWLRDSFDEETLKGLNYREELKTIIIQEHKFEKDKSVENIKLEIKSKTEIFLMDMLQKHAASKKII